MGSTRIYHGITLAKRLGLILMIYLLTRIFFFLFNIEFFPTATFSAVSKACLWGLQFDFSAIALTNSAFILLSLLPIPFRERKGYRFLLKSLFLTTNGIALLAIMGDIPYFQFALKRSAIDVFGFSQDILHLFPQYLRDYWHLFLLFIGLLFFISWAYDRAETKGSGFNTPTLPIQLGKLVFGLLLTILCIRGGISGSVLSPIDAVRHAGIELAPVVLNTPFNLLYSFQHQGIEAKEYLSEAEAKRLFQVCTESKGLPDSLTVKVRAQKKENVVFILLESFSQELIGAYGAENSATPFLDSLANESLIFTNMHANSSRSVDAVPCILASLPALMEEAFIFSQHQTNKVGGLGNHLKQEGYTTSFFHGGNNGSFHFDDFSKLAGFDNYYGRNEFGDETQFDGNWGIFDGPFFQYTAQELQKTQEPFCAGLFSLSSHTPYTLPTQFQGAFPDEPDPFRKSVRYTDAALRDFFASAKQMPWYENTLFVITADHRGPSKNEYCNRGMGFYEVPLLFFHPSGKLTGKQTFLSQQLDMVPTVLDYLNIEGTYCGFGKSLFRHYPNRYVVNRLYAQYQIMDERYFLRFDGEKAYKLFDYSNDSLLNSNVIEKFPAEAKRLEKQIMAVLQLYSHRMGTNQLVE